MPAKHPPVVQISLDLQTLADAIPTAETAVKAGIDWLEVGTPLILGEGLHAVRALHERFPKHPVVADLKTMDAGFLECEMMARAGAHCVVVMSRAHEGTVRGAVEAGRKYGVKVMADIMLEADYVEAARRCEAWGADYIIHHIGFDERHVEVGKSPMTDLKAVVDAVNIPVQAVGGLSIEQAIQCPKVGAPLVVIGAPLAVQDHQFAPGPELERILREICEKVHAQA
ncbi:MAG: orotidine 5'-phosphate decarboxylase [Planctomycetota bacterium]|nr:orotidine 5'-phosphate decarboxylase [Planctomycetota bacterium]